MAARLAFLARVVEKECVHLQSIDARLFADAFAADVARTVASAPVLAEGLVLPGFFIPFGRFWHNPTVSVLRPGDLQTPGTAG